MTLSRPAQDALWLERIERDGPPAVDSGELAATLQPSLRLLRAHRYWEAHETLEGLWLEALYPLRLFHYALIKVAVGLLHVERRGAAPAIRQLTQAALYLAPFAPAFAGLDTGAVLAQTRGHLDALAGAESGGAPDWRSLGEFTFPASNTS